MHDSHWLTQCYTWSWLVDIIAGLGKKTQKAREEAFMKLLNNFEKRESGKISLHGFFDCLDEHGVYVGDEEVDHLCLQADEEVNTRFWLVDTKLC